MTEAGEGHGETRPRTGPAAEDRVRARCDVRRRRERTPDGPRGHDRQEGCLDRPPDPLPTRVEHNPELPDDYRRALDAGLAALALTVDDAARSIIDGHVRLLLAWNRVINLTAIRDPAGIAIRHVVDSLTALPSLRDRGVSAVVDLGSGGGFPGLPLVAALPARQAVLVESVGKKARFLSTVVEATGLRGTVHVAADRAESLAAPDLPDGAAVLARGVAPLGELVELALPLLAPGRPLIAWKSGSAVDGPDEELSGARRAIAAIDPGAGLEIEPACPQNADGSTPEGEAIGALRDHRLVIVTRSSGRVDGAWPRDPAQRRRRPW